MMDIWFDVVNELAAELITHNSILNITIQIPTNIDGLTNHILDLPVSTWFFDYNNDVDLKR